MKKLIFLGSAALSLFTPAWAFADGTINLEPPAKIGFKSLSDFMQQALTLIFAVGAFLVLLMLIIGAYEWIASGGDKENVGKARGRIINALIGLIVLAVAFALVRLLGQFTGLDITKLTVPTPNPSLNPSVF